MTETDRLPAQILAPLDIRGRISRPQPKGLPVIGMGFNELPFGPTPRVAAAIADMAGRPNRYGDPTCAPLRRAIGERFGLDPEEIVCGNGSEELLDVVARSFVAPGDEIVISEYGYIQFPMIANRLRARLTKAPETGFTTDVDAMLAAVGPETALVLLANPNNPTGTVLPVAEIARLADGIPRHTPLVIDLAYGEFVGLDYCAAVHDLARSRCNLIVTRTFSKAFGLAGLRAGWLHAPGRLLPGFYAARGMGSVNAFAQAAAIAALADFDAAMERVAFIVAERERMRRELAALGVTSLESGANFLMCAFEDQAAGTADAFLEHLFDEAGIVANRTREAGLERFFRFSLSETAHNDALLREAAAFLGRNAV